MEKNLFDLDVQVESNEVTTREGTGIPISVGFACMTIK
ncbi:hypothetical protein EV586_10358 [Tumebacillus sp. BK434]|nr:FDLD family class I lanthipeptide [Tumebacillus sp. BK434]TCP55406.1 hypothetical protein EV586_10358 [Tumebacillus sp. BK434]